MSLLNRPPEYHHLYDSEGRLQGGLSALEELAQVIAIGSGNDDEADDIDDENEEMEPAHEFPVSAAHTSSSLDSDDDMSDDEPGSSDDDAMDEIAMYEEPRPQPTTGPTGLPETPLERFPSATLSNLVRANLHSADALYPEITMRQICAMNNAICFGNCTEPPKSAPADQAYHLTMEQDAPKIPAND